MKTEKTYFIIYGALVFFTGLTLLVSFLNLRHFNIAIALLIALAKTSLIVIYFMHLRSTNQVVWIFAGLGVGWMVLLVVGTANDFLIRMLATTP